MDFSLNITRLNRKIKGKCAIPEKRFGKREIRLTIVRRKPNETRGKMFAFFCFFLPGTCKIRGCAIFNDFNKYGQTYKVEFQSAPEYRDDISDVSKVT